MTRLLRDPILPGRDASPPGSKSPGLQMPPTLWLTTTTPVTASGCLETRSATYASTVYADFGRFEHLGLEPA